jgi:hypothetical protein
MLSPELQEFAKLLVQNVRDAAIKGSDINLKSGARGPVALRWRAASGDRSPEALARVVIPDVVDAAVFYLLRAIDEGLLTLSFSASNGKAVDLTADGLSELSGWYMGSEGWREEYSRERFFDDVSDLKHFFDEPRAPDQE